MGPSINTSHLKDLPMTRTLLALCALLLILPAGPAGAQETPLTFTADNGESVEAFQGHFEVPENRANPDSRTLTLTYVRFPATTDTPGAPIVYLAGGPGGSGTSTARGPRFPLFMAMRDHGDVIAFDQRGTGQSDGTERCDSVVALADDEIRSDAVLTERHRAAIAACAEIWTGKGIDILGYTTMASVADLSALRSHLGAERLSLWGISYGSHLALAAIDAIPDELDRVVMASVEGLDQTVKLPARTDAYFARIQAAIDTQPEARALYPDLAGWMRGVQADLEAEPFLVHVPREGSDPFPYLIQRTDAQQFASGLISDPQWVPYLLAAYRALEVRAETALGALLARFHRPSETIWLSLMPTMMDVASGISDERLALFEDQAPAGIVGGYLNFPMPQALGVVDGLDLGDDFRAGPTGDTPVLVLTGTLDGRTYIEGQAEAVAGLSNVTQVMVVNAGHNLFMTTPEVGEVMAEFMRGEPVHTTEITVDLPDFAANPFGASQ